jgi:hypothetical protein
LSKKRLAQVLTASKNRKAQRGNYLCAFQSNLIISIYNEVMQKFNKKEGKSLFFLPWCRVRLRDERAGLVKMKGKRA